MSTLVDKVVYERGLVSSSGGTIRFHLGAPHSLCGHPCTRVLLRFRSAKELPDSMKRQKNAATAEMKVVSVKTGYGPLNRDRRSTTVKYWQDQNVIHGIVWIANNIQRQNTDE